MSEEWAAIAVDNGRLLTEAITKLTAAERDRDGWELIAADQAAVVKLVLADLTTACDDLDAAERRAAVAEQAWAELSATVKRVAEDYQAREQRHWELYEQQAEAVRFHTDRADGLERENTELKATLGAAAQAGVELGQKLAAAETQRLTYAHQVVFATLAMRKEHTEALAFQVQQRNVRHDAWLQEKDRADAATARERAARERAQKILSDFHWAAYHRGPIALCPNDVCAAHRAALGLED